MATMMDELTERQQTYVKARIDGVSVKEAGERAGYTMNEASLRTHVERHPKIKVILRESNRAAMKKLELSREDVLQGFLDAVDASQTSQDLTVAWREIGRVLGVYEPTKVQVDVAQMSAAQMQELSTEELVSLAGMQGVLLEGEFSRSEDEEDDGTEQANLPAQSEGDAEAEDESGAGPRSDDGEGAGAGGDGGDGGETADTIRRGLRDGVLSAKDEAHATRDSAGEAEGTG